MAWIRRKSANELDSTGLSDAWEFVYGSDADGYVWSPDESGDVQAKTPSAGGEPSGNGEASVPAASGNAIGVPPQGYPAQPAIAGTAGADVFVLDKVALAFATAPVPAPVQIAGYSAAQGDVLDVSGILRVPPGLLSAETVPLRVTEDGSAAFSTLELSLGSQPGSLWIALAELDGVLAGDAVNVSLDATHTVELTAGWLV